MSFKEELKAKMVREDGTLYRSRCVKSYLQANEPKLYSELLEKTSFLSSTSSISERVYCILNDQLSAPICKCGKLVNYWRAGVYNEFCSNNCTESRKANMSRMKLTMLERYHTEHALQVPEFYSKSLDTLYSNHGVKSALRSLRIKEKFKSSMIRNHGVESPLKSEELKKKAANSFKETMQDPVKKEQYESKKKSTTNLKYGVNYYVLSDKFKEQSKKTSISNYGVKNFKQKHIDLKILKFLENKSKYKKWLFIMHNTLKRDLTSIAGILGVSATKVIRDFSDFGLKVEYFFRSSYELEFETYLKSLGITNIETNTRDIIDGELDLFIPEKNLAIEINGLYWHSFNRQETLDEKRASSKKTKLCREKGIELLTVLESEILDSSKKTIWMNILKNKVSNSLPSIYARKCQVLEIRDSTCTRNFYNLNHLQGYCKATTHLGLYFKEELVSVMSFSDTKNGNWELVRFCSLSSYRVQGGAGKLLSYFKNNYKPVKIVSFADLRYSSGNLYKTLGFTQESLVDPRYYYVLGKKLFHRRAFQKKRLKVLLGDKYDSSLTESELVFNYTRYRRIWDCGKIKFSLTI